MKVAAPVSATRYETSLKSACFTPLSFFHRNLDLEYTQLRVFALILVETLGAFPKPREFAEISVERFSETVRVSKEWILHALSMLDQSQMIRIRENDRGRATYAIREEYIQEAKGAGRQTVKGKCPDCQAIGEFSTEFIPTPHQALRKLGGCVNSAVFRVVLVVVRYTLKWGRDSHAVEVDPQELALNDFTRLTGLEAREITTGLTEAVKLGLIGRELRKGKPSLFWAIPEAFGALEKREARQVQQPERREKAKAAGKKTPDLNPEPAGTHAIESRAYLWGRCQNCRHLVAVEPISDEEFADYTGKRDAQAGKAPPRSPTWTKKKTKSATMYRDKVTAVASDNLTEEEARVMIADPDLPEDMRALVFVAWPNLK